jgi:hypothetical protein
VRSGWIDEWARSVHEIADPSQWEGGRGQERTAHLERELRAPEASLRRPCWLTLFRLWSLRSAALALVKTPGSSHRLELTPCFTLSPSPQDPSRAYFDGID